MSELVQSGGSTDGVWMPSDAAFGARLALIRQRMGWGNVKEAALSCGIPVQSWRSWERDGGKPRDYIRVCVQIAAATGCDYGWLVDRRPSQTSQPKNRPNLEALPGGGRTTAAPTPLLLSVPTGHNLAD